MKDRNLNIVIQAKNRTGRAVLVAGADAAAEIGARIAERVFTMSPDWNNKATLSALAYAVEEFMTLESALWFARRLAPA